MDGKTILIGAGAAAAGLFGYFILKGQATRAESQSLQNTVNAYSQGQIANYQSTAGMSPLNWQDVVNNPSKYGITFNNFGIPQIPTEVQVRLQPLGQGVQSCTAYNTGLSLSGANNIPFQTWFSTEILPYYSKYKSEIDSKLDAEEYKRLESLYQIYGTNPFIDYDKLYLADKVYEHKYGNGTINCDGTVSADVAVIDGVRYKIVGGNMATAWTPTNQMVNPVDDVFRFSSGDIWLESVGSVPADKVNQVLSLLSQGNVSGAKAVAQNSYTTPIEMSSNTQLAQNITQAGAIYYPGAKTGGYDASGTLKEWYKDGKWYSSYELLNLAKSQSTSGTVITVWTENGATYSSDSHGNVLVNESSGGG